MDIDRLLYRKMLSQYYLFNNTKERLEQVMKNIQEYDFSNEEILDILEYAKDNNVNSLLVDKVTDYFRKKVMKESGNKN